MRKYKRVVFKKIEMDKMISQHGKQLLRKRVKKE